MPFNLDAAFGIHVQTLSLRAQRAEMLASNLANADTPHYKARDMDFKRALSDVSRNGPTQTARIHRTHANHIQSAGDAGHQAGVLYRTPLQASLDGNTVDAQIEQVEFSRNAMDYQTSMRFLDGKIKGLLTAIRGD